MTDEARVEAVAREMARAAGRDPDGKFVGYMPVWEVYRDAARAAIRAVSPLIIERCAEVAEAVMASFDRNGDFDEAFGAKSAAVDIRALIQKEPSCAPAGVTSPPR